MNDPVAKSPSVEKSIATRGQFSRFVTISTRWMDNDAYAHINNVVYYSFFDTAVNELLIDEGLLNPGDSPVIGLVVESGCRYHASMAFPDRVHAGVRVAKLGSSSVRYEIALFRNDEEQASAEGHFVHVHVDRTTNRPVPVPAATRLFLEKLAG